MFAGGVAVGMLGYLFQIIMGRMLSVAEYGLFSMLMAVMVVVGAPLATLTMVVSRKVSSYRSTQNANNRIHLFYSVNRKVFLAVTILIISLVFYIEPLQYFLKVESEIHLYLLILALLIAFPQAVNNAYLQGLQYFKLLSISVALSTLLKIIFSVVLVWVGFGVSGALGGVVLSSLALFLGTYLVLKPSLRRENKHSYNKNHLSFKSAIPVFLANIAFVIMTQIDMVIVKYYFTEQDAGLYAAASILGKAVLYLPSGIAIALFPMVAENHAEGESSTHLFFQAVGVTAVLCTMGSLLYYYFSEHIIVLLYGPDYIEAAEILKYFGFAMLPMALIMVAEHFLIAKGRVLFAYLFMIIAPLQLIGIYFYHDTMLNIVVILSISGVTLVIVGYGLLWRTYKNATRAA